jgi:beta-glucosidase-like glycosyl hydrolase
MVQLILAAALALTPVQKARLLVVTTERPGIFTGAAHITFADQEGGVVQAFQGMTPLPASGYTSTRQALAAGRETRRELRDRGVDVDFAPVFDTSDGPLGSRQFADSRFADAFARGLGDAACPKHFPGLGSAAVSTDERPHVDAHVRPKDLAPYRTAIAHGLQCVMVGHAFYGTRFRALGFHGIAITDSLSLVHAAPVERWARQAARAGADMLLFTSRAHARRAIRALVPLARRGELDEHVARVLRYRRMLGR